MKIILLFLIPFILLAQSVPYSDTLFTKYGKIYPCFIKEVDQNLVKIIRKENITATAAWKTLSKAVMEGRGVIYENESGFKFDLDSLIAYTKRRAQKVKEQTEGEIIRIELKDGSVWIGKIISEDESTLKIHSSSGVESTIPKSQIIKREIITGKIVKGTFWREDPNTTRLFFAPTGRALKKGQGYFSAYEIFFPFVAIGITDYFTLAGGMSLFPGASTQLVYLAPKITPIQQENYDVSAGVLYLKIPEESDGAGIAYGVGTFGSEKSSLTVGLGYGFSGGDFADKPVLALGGDLRVGRYTKLISENWIFVGGDVHLLSGGIRFFGENLAADFALIFPLTGEGIEGFPFLPWIGFAYNFGSK